MTAKQYIEAVEAARAKRKIADDSVADSIKALPKITLCMGNKTITVELTSACTLWADQNGANSIELPEPERLARFLSDLFPEASEGT